MKYVLWVNDHGMLWFVVVVVVVVVVSHVRGVGDKVLREEIFF